RWSRGGVPDMNTVGVAAGVAVECYALHDNPTAPLPPRRCYEQVAVDLCLHNVPVRLIGNGGGVVYAPLGPTHEAIEDIAIMRALPRMTIVAPADAEEMRRFMPLTVDYPGPIYIRVGKGGDPIVSNDRIPFQIGKALPMREGREVLIVTTGITLKVGLDAATALAERGIEAAVLHMHTIKPLDVDALREYADPVSVIV